MSSAVPRRVLVIGGTSEIGLAIVRRLHRAGPVAPALMGRDREALELALLELEQGGCTPGFVEPVDATDTASHEAAIAAAFERAGGFDVVVLAVGILGDRLGLDGDPAGSAEVMSVDFAGAGSLLLAALRALRAGGGGTLVVLSSAAAVRPRASNAVYGAAKAGLDALAQAMADTLAGTATRVLIVRPGFVRGRMTAGLPVPPLATTPDAVAAATVKGLDGERGTVWAPPLLGVVFAILRLLPRPVWRRLPL